MDTDQTVTWSEKPSNGFSVGVVSAIVETGFLVIFRTAENTWSFNGEEFSGGKALKKAKSAAVEYSKNIARELGE